MSSAVEAIYDETERVRTADTLAETAYLLWKGGKEEDARACLAAARDLSETPPTESTVARTLLEVALAPVLNKVRQEDQEQDESSLLVEP